LDQALGMFETVGLTPALVALDRMEKESGIQVHQVEINDFLGVIIKISGSAADVDIALHHGRNCAEQMGAQPIILVIRNPDSKAWKIISSKPEYNPLIQQDVVSFPQYTTDGNRMQEESQVNSHNTYALGFIETQGFTAVFEAIDSACKAANVEVVGKEKLGGGYVTVVIKGDVAAVEAAIAAGRTKVDGLGKLIAAHVIPRPSASVIGLLPQI
jgi:microcompartment protein CcmL/EutN